MGSRKKDTSEPWDRKLLTPGYLARVLSTITALSEQGGTFHRALACPHSWPRCHSFHTPHLYTHYKPHNMWSSLFKQLSFKDSETGRADSGFVPSSSVSWASRSLWWTRVTIWYRFPLAWRHPFACLTAWGSWWASLRFCVFGKLSSPSVLKAVFPGCGILRRGSAVSVLLRRGGCLRTRWLFSGVAFTIVLEAPAMSNLIRTDFAAISCFCAETLLIFLNL